MKLLRDVVVLAVAAAALLALEKSGIAQDNTCVLNCNTTKKDCVQQARTDALACKQACRDNSAPTELGACNRLCAADFRGKKDKCRDDHKTCHEGCSGSAPGGGPPENQDCLKGCAKDFAGCARDTGKSTKDCVSGCRTAADRSSCMQGCADSAKGLSADCGTTLETCRTNCGSPAPTPSGP